MIVQDALEAIKTSDQKRDFLTQAQTIFPRGIWDELPLSFSQQRLWFLYQLEPTSSAYNKSIALHIQGALNLTALEQSLNSVLRRHKVLRTTLNTVDGQLVQTVVPTLTLTLPVVELRELPEGDRSAAVQRLVVEAAQQPFNLERDPFLRSLLFQLGEVEFVLTLTIHGLIADDRSITILLEDLAVLYNAFSSGNASPLPELPIQYTDFADWQRQQLQTEELQRQLAYWKQQLGGNLPVLQLPVDRPRPSRQTFRGARQSLAISNTLTDQLENLSRQEGVTPFIALLAAFKVLLYRYTAQDDILVGTPVSGRNWAETKGLIGLFANSLVLRTDLSNHPCFKALLARVREVTLAADAHQELPFEKLVEELQPEPDLSRNPLFQVQFVFQTAPTVHFNLSGLTLGTLPVDRTITHCDLTLEMEYHDQALVATFEYNADLFDVTTINRMLQHFQTLLESIVANPQQSILDLPLLRQAEQQQLLVAWNRTQTDYPKQTCIHQLFEAQVDRTPDEIAIVFADQQLTYRELDQQANQFAHYLRSLGVAPETMVGVCMERCLEIGVAVLGIFKAGGACVPLDLTDPEEHLAFMLEDTQLSVLLTQTPLLEQKQFLQAIANRVQVVCVDTAWKEYAQASTQAPTTDVTSTNLAYVAYTSGSTGRPKGVMVSHIEVCSRQSWLESTFQLTAAERFLMGAYRGLVLHYVLLSPLLFGGRVIIAPPGGNRDIAQFVRLIAKYEITSVYLVPSLLPFFLPQPGLQDCKHLRQVFCGSEALRVEFKDHFFACLNADLHNLYGLTEATFSTFHCCDRTHHSSHHSVVPIGRPTANTQIYLLDAHMQPVPIGVPGELYVGGDNLARGYLNRSDLTAERFIPNPFSLEPGSRLYKTGDLARFLPDGTIEYLGRIDQQVKIRGFRIELGEIEAALRQYSAVQQVVVMAREDVPGEKRLVAYVVPKPDQSVTLTEFRSFLTKKLPTHMVPAAFVLLQALPLMPNGKVDRGALPAPDTDRPELAATFVAPQTPVETVLAEVWAKVLGLKQVGIHDNFFELGGDSILTLQVIAKAKHAGLVFTPKQLFQHSTIAELATVAGTTAIVEVEQGLVTGPVLFTPIQRWFFEQEFTKPHHWNQAILLQVQRPLQWEWLQQAVQQLLMHHDALRMRFTRSNSGWQQVNTLPDSHLSVTRVNLSALPVAEQVGAIETTAAEVQASLNLESGPLLQVIWFELDANQPSRLLIVIHHLVIDGVSWRILLEDLQTAYQQLSRGDAISLPAKTMSFQQWAQQLSEYAQSETLSAELNDWLEVSHDPISLLPLDFCEGDNTEASAQTVSISLSAAETQALLQEVPQAYNTQINDVLLTALVQTFAEWTGKHSLLVDLEGHGREEILEGVDVSRTVGWFTALFPVQLQLEDAAPGEALKAVKEQLRRIPNRGIGYGLLRYLQSNTAISTQLQAQPQAEVIFNYLGQTDQVWAADAVFTQAPESSGAAHSPHGQRCYLLEINALVVGGQLRLDWTYSRDRHQQRTIEQLAQNFVKAMQALIAHCQSPESGGYTPSDFPNVELDPDELEKALAEMDFS